MMWSSKTDYSKLYGSDYFGKKEQSASFDGNVLPAGIIAFCKTHSINDILDVGSGSGRLKNSLTASGLNVVACDYEPAHEDAVHYDLTLLDEQQNTALHTQISARFAGREHVVTCFDVLEHIDVEDVSNAVFNLHDLTADWIIFSISTRPSSRGNAYHSTILPLATWQRIFEITGFEITDGDFMREGRWHAPTQSSDPELKLINHWASADIFKDHALGEPCYVIARKVDNPERDKARRAIEKILDIAFRRIKRRAFVLETPKVVALNVHHIQDFFNLRSLLDVFPRDQVIVFVRRGMLLDDEFQLVSGYCRKCGVRFVEYERVADIDWRLFDIDVLLSAAESTAAINHALSLQLVEAAKLHGIHTILLQHGIWIEPMADRQIYFGSESVLTWGGEQKEFLNRNNHLVAGLPTTYGKTDATHFLPIGSPRFFDSLVEPNPEILKWRLGIDTQRYQQVVLVGTNLRWSAHGRSVSEIMAAVKATAECNQDKFFLVKPHPSERYSDYADLEAENVLVIDDILLGCMDLSIARLLAGASVVVSSLSTLLLDGAVLGKRCIQYDTGNKFEYLNCRSFALGDIPLAVQNENVGSFENAAFIKHYNDADNLNFFGEFSKLINGISHRKPNGGCFIFYSALKAAEDSWLRYAHLARQNASLAAHNQELARTSNELQTTIEAQHAAFEATTEQLKLQNEASAARSEQLQDIVEAYRNSSSWKITAPYRVLGHQLKRAIHLRRALPEIVARHGGLGKMSRRAIGVYRQEGLSGLKRAWRRANGASNSEAGNIEDDYMEWLRRYGTPSEEAREQMQKLAASWQSPPKISVVMPVYNPEVSWLEAAINSVKNQIYENWEMCIADDCSTDPEVRKLLENCSRQDERIRLTFRETNGHISAASNSALELAGGDWIALLDQDDLLPEDALYHVASCIVENPSAGVIYSDEDKIDESGARFSPYFKPDWNPDLFRSHNMVCHLGAYRTNLVKDLGGFRKGYEGAQDYDLALRCTERLGAAQIIHIPRVLYHWRSHSGSTAQAADNKNYATLAGKRALDEHLARIGLNGTTEILNTGMYRVRYEIAQPAPLVSLIIPTRNSLTLLKQCVDSILQKTLYPSYEILIIDNNSDDPATLAYLASTVKDGRVRVVRDGRPFNYSALNNNAVLHTRGNYIGLINNDIEVISPEWLDEMMGLAMQPGAGAIGARLWYPDDTLQHGGVILGIGGVAGHSHKRLTKGQHGYFGRAELIQTLSAVTAACLVIKKSIYEEVGGLDEHNLSIAFNDVDFCLRVREAGYRNIWTPYAELYHHESATRGLENTLEKQQRFQKEVLYMLKRWNGLLDKDPAYNVNLTLDYEDFSLAWPPRGSSHHKQAA
jgi:glycosyltransferase involved in cell wall biosynthesis